MAHGHRDQTKPRPASGSRQYGCCDVPSACDDGCGLDCLVQPRFFHGQLLTDRDLRQLLTWTKDRLRLSHYRDGWGVVCGLGIRCDPRHHDRVIVAPGYAVSCCGDDIVACEDTWVDLCEACRVEQDPCADPYDQKKPTDSRTGANDIDGAGDRVTHPPDWTGTPDGDERDDLRAVDLYISYVEQPTEPVAALGRSSCRTTTDCEYSRTRESYEITWRHAPLCDDPVSAAAERWHERYDDCQQILVRFKEFYGRLTAGDAPDPRTVNPQLRRWLLHWVDEHPLTQFCGIRDLICRIPDDAENEQVRTFLGRILFYIVQDCRNSMLQCDCDTCGEDDAVPLGRVYLRVSNENGKRRCHVVWIDPYPPYRRPLGRDCWPAPTGWVNVGRAIWHRPGDACTILTDLGLHVGARIEHNASGLDFADRSDRLFVRCGDTVTLEYVNAPRCGPRVVGVIGATQDGGDTASPDRPTIGDGPRPKAEPRRRGGRNAPAGRQTGAAPGAVQ